MSGTLTENGIMNILPTFNANYSTENLSVAVFNIPTNLAS